MPLSCGDLELEESGDYSWVIQSDFPEQDDHGQWNFVAHDADSGILFFTDTESVLFERSADELLTSRDGFRPCRQATTQGADADSLPEVPPPELYQHLQGTCWRKTNAFDVDRIPDQLVFGTDGNFEASYRNGTCRHGGIFTVAYRDLVQQIDENDCGRQQNARAFPQEGPELIEGVLSTTAENFSMGQVL